MPLIFLMPEEILHIWVQIAPMIEKAMVRNQRDKNYDVDLVLKKLINREWQCWIGVEDDAIQVVYVTRIQEMPKRNIFWLLYIGARSGSIDGWIDHLEGFKTFARDNNCSVIQGEGRDGWIKKINPTRTWTGYEFEVEQ